MRLKKQANKDELNKLYETYFSVIGSAHVDNINEELEDSVFDESHDFDNLDSWFENFQKEKEALEKKQKRKRIYSKISKRIAMVLVLVLSSTVVLSMTVEAFRVKLIDIFMQDNGALTYIQFTDPEEDETSHDYEFDGVNRITYLPKGFEHKETFTNMTMVVKHFTDGETIISVSRMSPEASINLDMEDAVISETYINGNKAKTSEKEAVKIVVWREGDAIYIIHSDISLDELVKIARSFKSE